MKMVRAGRRELVRAGGITGLSGLYEEFEGRDDDKVLPVMVPYSKRIEEGLRSRVIELF